MTARTIRIMTYVSGLLTGVILTLIVVLCIKHRHDNAIRQQEEALMQEAIEQALVGLEKIDEMDDPYYETSETRNYEETTLFDHPREELKGVRAVVYQVLPSGNALAELMDKNYYFKSVVLLAKEGYGYYDRQEIRIPSKKKVMVIGTCRFGESTVPVIDIMDK